MIYRHDLLLKYVLYTVFVFVLAIILTVSEFLAMLDTSTSILKYWNLPFKLPFLAADYLFRSLSYFTGIPNELSLSGILFLVFIMNILLILLILKMITRRSIK